MYHYKRLFGRSISFTTSLTSTQILGPNEKRVALVFCATATAESVTFEFGGPAVVNTGLTFVRPAASASIPIRIDRDWVGDNIVNAVFAVGGTGGIACSMVEVIRD